MKLAVALVLLGLLVAAEAVAAEHAQPRFHRKLAQRFGGGGGGYGRGRRNDRGWDPDAQFARNQAAAINTQQAIRAAEASGADPWATRGAAGVGSTNAWLASQGSDWVYAPNALIG